MLEDNGNSWRSWLLKKTQTILTTLSAPSGAVLLGASSATAVLIGLLQLDPATAVGVGLSIGTGLAYSMGALNDGIKSYRGSHSMLLKDGKTNIENEAITDFTNKREPQIKFFLDTNFRCRVIGLLLVGTDTIIIALGYTYGDKNFTIIAPQIVQAGLIGSSLLFFQILNWKFLTPLQKERSNTIKKKINKHIINQDEKIKKLEAKDRLLEEYFCKSIGYNNEKSNLEQDKLLNIFYNNIDRFKIITRHCPDLKLIKGKEENIELIVKRDLLINLCKINGTDTVLPLTLDELELVSKGENLYNLMRQGLVSQINFLEIKRESSNANQVLTEINNDKKILNLISLDSVETTAIDINDRIKEIQRPYNFVVRKTTSSSEQQNLMIENILERNETVELEIEDNKAILQSKFN